MVAPEDALKGSDQTTILRATLPRERVQHLCGAFNVVDHLKSSFSELCRCRSPATSSAPQASRLSIVNTATDKVLRRRRERIGARTVRAVRALSLATFQQVTTTSGSNLPAGRRCPALPRGAHGSSWRGGSSSTGLSGSRMSRGVLDLPALRPRTAALLQR